MKLRRLNKRPDRSPGDHSFFARKNRDFRLQSSAGFFLKINGGHQSLHQDAEIEEASQAVGAGFVGEENREEGAVSEDTEGMREVVAGEDGGRNEEGVGQQVRGREDEEPSLGALQDDEVALQDVREELPDRDSDENLRTPSATREVRQGARGGAVPVVQRKIGDGHDLTASRFAGDLRLEAGFDGHRFVRRGDRGLHVMRLRQALVEQGVQLPGVGVDGRFVLKQNELSELRKRRMDCRWMELLAPRRWRTWIGALPSRRSIGSTHCAIRYVR